MTALYVLGGIALYLNIGAFFTVKKYKTVEKVIDGIIEGPGPLVPFLCWPITLILKPGVAIGKLVGKERKKLPKAKVVKNETSD